ncbi:MYB DNA binding protein/ transcription factor-like protein, partial [Thalassiosira pseudonana CCMP1335]
QEITRLKDLVAKSNGNENWNQISKQMPHRTAVQCRGRWKEELRVKLYRLNMDGTWDDCGTGRIQFYYARQ